MEIVPHFLVCNLSRWLCETVGRLQAVFRELNSEKWD